jgi:hypothetical protein
MRQRYHLGKTKGVRGDRVYKFESLGVFLYKRKGIIVTGYFSLVG